MIARFTAVIKVVDIQEMTYEHFTITDTLDRGQAL